MGVLTSSQFMDNKKKEKHVVQGNKPAHIYKPNDGRILAFKFANAPEGKCNAFVANQNGDNYKLELVDGVFTVPESWEDAKKQELRKILNAESGWEDISHIEAGDKPEPIVEKIYTYFALHPDHTKDEPINGEVATVLKKGTTAGAEGPEGDEEVKLVCKNGIVETEDKQIYESLIEKGWTEAKKPKLKKKDEK